MLGQLRWVENGYKVRVSSGNALYDVRVRLAELAQLRTGDLLGAIPATPFFAVWLNNADLPPIWLRRCLPFLAAAS
jgi:hypothetical protein